MGLGKQPGLIWARIQWHGNFDLDLVVPLSGLDRNGETATKKTNKILHTRYHQITIISLVCPM